MTREEAIEYLHKLFMQADFTDAYGDMDDTEPYENAIDMAIEALQQKTGKWITKSDTNPYYTTWWYECSECGQNPLQDGYGQEVLSDYCPNCGAKMEEEQ